MSRVLRIALVFAALCIVVAPSARAERRVFLNGLDLKDVEVADQSFDGCSVRFDGDGNVHITAPGFEVKKRKAAASDESAGEQVATLTRRYYLAHKGDRVGKVQYEVAIYINGKRVKTVLAGADDGVVEITRYLSAGQNAVRLVATKTLGKSGKRRSFSPKDRLEIIIGEGEVEKGVVTIRRTVVKYARNASETGPFTDRFRFATR